MNTETSIEIIESLLNKTVDRLISAKVIIAEIVPVNIEQCETIIKLVSHAERIINEINDHFC